MMVYLNWSLYAMTLSPIFIISWPPVKEKQGREGRKGKRKEGTSDEGEREGVSEDRAKGGGKAN